MYKQILILKTILLVFVVGSPAMAEIKGGAITVSPFVGTYVYDGSQRLEPSLAAGARLGYNLDKNWGLEGQFTYAFLRNKGKFGGLYNASGDLLYHFIPESKLVPFLLIGGGLSETDYVVSKSRNALFEYGVGIKYFIRDAVALRWDARQMYLLHFDNNRAPTNYWQNSEFTFGLSYEFGGKKSVSPAVKEDVSLAVAQPTDPEPTMVKEEPAQENPSNWKAENPVESPVMSKIKDGAITVSPFVGAYVYDGSQQLVPSFTTGVGLGYNLDKNWGLEGQLTYALLRNFGKFGGLYNVSADLLYHFIPESKVVPYLLTGAGLSYTDHVNGRSRNGIFEYGAGIKYFISDAVALRWEARQMFLLNSTNHSNSIDYWQNSEFTVGLFYQFGGNKSVSPAVKEVVQAQEKPSTWKAENTIAPAGKNLITGMRVDKNEFEIFATEPIRNYKVFTLTQPSRLVLDIPNGASGFIQDKVVINRLGIDAVRFESYPEYLRIFFDASQGLMILYKIEETATGLKIIVTGS